MWKVFAREYNRQMLMDVFLLYEESPADNSSINMIYIIRVSSGSILVWVAFTEKSLLAVIKDALCSYPPWKLDSKFLVTL